MFHQDFCLFSKKLKHSCYRLVALDGYAAGWRMPVCPPLSTEHVGRQRPRGCFPEVLPGRITATRLPAAPPVSAAKCLHPLSVPCLFPHTRILKHTFAFQSRESALMMTMMKEMGVTCTRLSLLPRSVTAWRS